MNLGSPASTRLADGLRAVFFSASVPSGCTLTMVLSSDRASILIRMICSSCRTAKDTIQHTCLGPAIHSGVDRMPVTETQRQPPPFAAVFGHIQDRVKHFEIGDAHIAALMRKASLYPTILGLCDFHSPNIPTNRPLVLTGPSCGLMDPLSVHKRSVPTGRCVSYLASIWVLDAAGVLELLRLLHGRSRRCLFAAPGLQVFRLLTFREPPRRGLRSHAKR